MSAETVETLLVRIKELEKESKLKNNDKFVETELTERVASRLISWSRIFAFFVGIPLVLWIATLALFTGRTYKNLRDVAEAAKRAVAIASERAKSEADQARSEAESARNTAQQVRQESAQLSNELTSTKREVADLAQQLHGGAESLQSLGLQIESSKRTVSSLEESVREQSGQVQKLSIKVSAIRKEQSESAVAQLYPVYSNVSIGTPNGLVSAPLKKNPEHILVNVQLATQLGEKPSVDTALIAAFLTKLTDQGYETLLGEFSLLLSTKSHSKSSWVATISAWKVYSMVEGYLPPCVVYFKPELKESAEKITSLASSAQQIDRSRIVYVDPKSWSKQERELIEKSGVDVIVVFGRFTF